MSSAESGKRYDFLSLLMMNGSILTSGDRKKLVCARCVQRRKACLPYSGSGTPTSATEDALTVFGEIRDLLRKLLEAQESSAAEVYALKVATIGNTNVQERVAEGLEALSGELYALGSSVGQQRVQRGPGPEEAESSRVGAKAAEEKEKEGEERKGDDDTEVETGGKGKGKGKDNGAGEEE